MIANKNSQHYTPKQKSRKTLKKEHWLLILIRNLYCMNYCTVDTTAEIQHHSNATKIINTSKKTGYVKVEGKHCRKNYILTESTGTNTL